MRRIAALIAIVGAAAAGSFVPVAASTQHGQAPTAPLRVVAMPRPTDAVVPPPPGISLPLVVSRPPQSFLAPWPGDMGYYGGQIVRNAHVYIDFWGWSPHPSAEQSAYANMLQSFMRGVGGSTWLGVTSQFAETAADGSQHFIGNPKGLLRGVWRDSSTPPVKDGYPETLLVGEARRAAQHFGVLGDRDAIVLVASPHGHNPAGFTDGTYCAWHSWTRGIAFINLPYLLDTSGGCGSNFVNNDGRGYFDGVSMVSGHELAEAMTDPGVGYEGPGAGWHDMDWQENADKCEWIPAGYPGGALDVTLSTGRFAVQQIWSNAALGGAGDCAAA
jgi:hypothetical protein